MFEVTSMHVLTFWPHPLARYSLLECIGHDESCPKEVVTSKGDAEYPGHPYLRCRRL